MIEGLDLSNLQDHPDTWPGQPWYALYQAAEFALIQAIAPPPGYPGHDFIDPETGQRGYTGVQLRRAQADGKKVGIYVWLWNTVADVATDIRARLACVPADLVLDMRPWIDVEDETATSVDIRRQAVAVSRPIVDEWAAGRGLPPSGGYSRDQYVTDFLGGWWPDGWVYWQASYGSDPSDLLLARPLRQFTSTPIDEDSMLESELVTAVASRETPADYPFNDWQRSAIAYRGALDLMGGQLDQVHAQLTSVTSQDQAIAARLQAALTSLRQLRRLAA